MYWLWLTSKPGMTSTKITYLFEHYETIEEIYSAKEYKKAGPMPPAMQSALKDKSLGAAKRIYEETKRIGARALVFDDDSYPEMLRNIIDPPYVLYIKGENMQWDKLFTIGVVGTRNYDDYGKITTVRLCSQLARCGVTIVSGMARGIDSIAANSALRANGKTIAVLGSGLDVIYPPENKELYRRITEHGAVISEYPPGSEALRGHFPERNRIIAGLSRGVLVTEAPRRSGSLITARYALENNRDVFAVPGNILNERYAGTNSIIQSFAKLVMSAEDIIAEYPYDAARLIKAMSASGEKERPVTAEEIHEEIPEDIPEKRHVSADDERYSELNETEKLIIKYLTERNMKVDEIIRGSGISAGEINTGLLMLEIKGMVRRLPGNCNELKI